MAPRLQIGGGPQHGPVQEVQKAANVSGTLSRLLKYFSASKKLLAGLLISAAAVTVTSLAAPALQGDAIDSMTGKDWSGLKMQLLILLVIFILNSVFSLAQSLLSVYLSQVIVRRMRQDLFDKIDHLPIAYLDTHSSGDVMSRMTNDIDNISNTISQSLGSLISGVLTLVGTAAIMFWYCWQLTLISMISVILTCIATKVLSAKMRKAYKARSRGLGRLNAHAEEMITGYKSILACNQQEKIKQEFGELSDELTEQGIRAEILGGSMGPLMTCISGLSFVIVAAFGGYYALKGLITIGVISAFIIYAKQFSRPINDLAQLYGSLQTAMASAERVFELLDQPDEDNSGTEIIDNLTGSICFDHVDFAYEENKPVLQDFSLEIQPGQKIALVGATGSGKTTIVNLLMRFYPIDGGNIYIDDIDIQDLNRDWLRKNMAIVLQDTVLFSDTIENNIKYSNPSASDEAMLEAAKTANCAGFIEHMKDKYQTYLSQAGASLSHGQRQLINIARALLADPKILILDEATSSVDTRTEQMIQDALTSLMKNRTSLIIAHRLSTIQDADVIVVLDHGQVVETGNHNELMAKQGKYYKLYMTQFAGQKT